MGLNDVIKFFISGDGAKYGLIVGGVLLGVAAIAYIIYKFCKTPYRRQANESDA